MPAVIKHVQPDRYRVTFFDAESAPHYDGMAALWFKDADKARRWYTTPDMVTALNDGFFEVTDQKPVVLVCEEHVIMSGSVISANDTNSYQLSTYGLQR
ncbi:MAG TPA: hypothetical protein EYG51_16090 [Pseudomonadales bacterium]|nr:hypothetical protein [Pseudomonadales bacterium]